MGIELRNSDFSGVFWGLGTAILRLTTVGVNHSANLPDLRANYNHKLVYKLIKVSITRFCFPRILLFITPTILSYLLRLPCIRLMIVSIVRIFISFPSLYIMSKVVWHKCLVPADHYRMRKFIHAKKCKTQSDLLGSKAPEDISTQTNYRQGKSSLAAIALSLPA